MVDEVALARRSCGYLLIPTVVKRPRGGMPTHPSYTFDYFAVKLFKGPMENRLVMGDAIAKSPECVGMLPGSVFLGPARAIVRRILPDFPLPITKNFRRRSGRP